MNILAVCHGNINRSPAVEMLLCNADIGLKCRSRGFAAEGLSMAKKMRVAISRYKVPFAMMEQHRSQHVTALDIEWADMIIYMDGGNLKRLKRFILSSGLDDSSVDKLKCLGDWADVPRIPDPGFMRKDSVEFIETVQLIVSCVENIIREFQACVL